MFLFSYISFFMSLEVFVDVYVGSFQVFQLFGKIGSLLIRRLRPLGYCPFFVFFFLFLFFFRGLCLVFSFSLHYSFLLGNRTMGWGWGWNWIGPLKGKKRRGLG